MEGASEGVGLGHRFLRHVERTRFLLHVLDISGSEGRDPLEDYEIVNKELEKYLSLIHIWITPLGLIEMTRKKVSRSLSRMMETTCPCCDGKGRIPLEKVEI